MNLGFTLAKDETVIRKINKHWIVLAPVVLADVVVIAIIIGLTYLYGRYRSDFPAHFNTADLFSFVVIFIILAMIMLYGGLWVYRRNFLVLTNQHLVRVEQRGLFAHSVSQLSLGRVQDVSGKVSGFLPTILGFGDIVVETAGAEDNFIFNTVGNPSEVSATCLKVHEQYAPDAEEHLAQAAPAGPPPGMVEEMVYVPAPATSPAAPQVEPMPMTESVPEKIEHPEG
jgi:uncharacterized membrane protein YdbT with pleckstrin-like domain